MQEGEPTHPAPAPCPVADVLSRVAAGEDGASEALLTLVYDELKALARARVRRLRAGQTIRATALVHEAWIRLGAGQAQEWEDRAHFFGAAANAMRNILVDQARARNRQKRGGGDDAAELHTGIAASDSGPDVDMIALDEALQRLGRDHERPARIVMLRYFTGLTIPEVADLLGISKRTVDRDWLFARTWLRRALGDRDTRSP